MWQMPSQQSRLHHWEKPSLLVSVSKCTEQSVIYPTSQMLWAERNTLPPPQYHHHGRSIPQAAVGTCPVLLSLARLKSASIRQREFWCSVLIDHIWSCSFGTEAIPKISLGGENAILLSSHPTELKSLICMLKNSILFCFKNDLFWNLIYPNEWLFHLQTFQRTLLFPALYKEKMNVLLHS